MATVALTAAVALLSSSAAWAGSSRSQAGYRATHDAFRSVRASWVVPSISCPGTSSVGYNGSASFGVGMGPSYPDSEQVVTEAFCTGIVASYVAYFEVGGVQVTGSAGGVPVNLHHGDRISASVTYLGIRPFRSGPYTYRRSLFRFAIFDRTQGKHFQRTSSADCVRYRCDHSTAEVSAGAAHSALADYGKVSFSGIALRDTRGRGGAFSNRAPWKVTKLIEFNASTHHRAASPSPLGHGGTRFSDFWLAY